MRKILSKSEFDFIKYDPVIDCINPYTGEKLATDSDSPMEKYHAFRTNKFDYDVDVSYEACSIYKLAFPFMETCGKDEEGVLEIVEQKKFNQYKLKKELQGSHIDFTFRGDTMNSAATTFKAFYGIVEAEEDLPHQAMEFVDYYHTPGNFMVLPYKPGCGLNGPRGKGATKDYMDLYLLAVYNYYQALEEKEIFDFWMPQNVYGVNNQRQILFFTEYLNTFRRNGKPSFDVFVEMNLFQDYVEEIGDASYGIPKELWEGHFANSATKESVFPATITECIQFWENATNLIKKRGLRMYERIHS